MKSKKFKVVIQNKKDQEVVLRPVIDFEGERGELDEKLDIEEIKGD